MATTCFYQNGSSPWYTDGDPHGLPIGMSSDGYFIYGQYQKHTQLSPDEEREPQEPVEDVSVLKSRALPLLLHPRG